MNTNPNPILKTFIVSVYRDGRLKVTEKQLPRRDSSGKFTRSKPVVVRQATCPKCGAEIGLVAI